MALYFDPSFYPNFDVSNTISNLILLVDKYMYILGSIEAKQKLLGKQIAEAS